MASGVKIAGKAKWHLIDATGKRPGRLAVQVCKLIMGKHKPTYTPNQDMGDNVCIINAEKYEFTGRKKKDKIYRWHTGYPGGLKERDIHYFETHGMPCEVLRRAINGMLPKNNLRKRRMLRVQLYAGEEHDFHSRLGEETAEYLKNRKLQFGADEDEFWDDPNKPIPDEILDQLPPEVAKKVRENYQREQDYEKHVDDLDKAGLLKGYRNWKRVNPVYGA